MADVDALRANLDSNTKRVDLQDRVPTQGSQAPLELIFVQLYQDQLHNMDLLMKSVLDPNSVFDLTPYAKGDDLSNPMVRNEAETAALLDIIEQSEQIQNKIYSLNAQLNRDFAPFRSRMVAIKNRIEGRLSQSFTGRGILAVLRAARTLFKFAATWLARVCSFFADYFTKKKTDFANWRFYKRELKAIKSDTEDRRAKALEIERNDPEYKKLVNELNRSDGLEAKLANATDELSEAQAHLTGLKKDKVALQKTVEGNSKKLKGSEANRQGLYQIFDSNLKNIQHFNSGNGFWHSPTEPYSQEENLAAINNLVAHNESIIDELVSLGDGSLAIDRIDSKITAAETNVTSAEAVHRKANEAVTAVKGQVTARETAVTRPINLEGKTDITHLEDNYGKVKAGVNKGYAFDRDQARLAQQKGDTRNGAFPGRKPAIVAARDASRTTFAHGTPMPNPAAKIRPPTQADAIKAGLSRDDAAAVVATAGR